MKFLYFMQSLFVPSCMIKRRKMNVFISIAILLLCSFLIALPMINYFSKDRYAKMDDYFNFDLFAYCVDDSSSVGQVTEDEKNLYNMVDFDDIKALGIKANKNGVTYTDKLENAKEYVVKSYVPNKDEEGTITSYTTYYIHILVDDYDANNGGEATYNIENTFCKYAREEDGETFNHILVAFYNTGIIYLASDTYSNAITLTYAKNTEIDCTEATDMTYISHALTDLLYKIYQYQATKKTFLYGFCFPILLSLVIGFVIGKSGALSGSKEYLALCAIVSITPTLFSFCVSWINLKWCSYAFAFYPMMFVFYFLVVIIILNRRHRLHKDEEFFKGESK